MAPLLPYDDPLVAFDADPSVFRGRIREARVELPAAARPGSAGPSCWVERGRVSHTLSVSFTLALRPAAPSVLARLLDSASDDLPMRTADLSRAMAPANASLRAVMRWLDDYRLPRAHVSTHAEGGYVSFNTSADVAERMLGARFYALTAPRRAPSYRASAPYRVRPDVAHALALVSGGAPAVDDGTSGTGEDTAVNCTAGNGASNGAPRGYALRLARIPADQLAAARSVAADTHRAASLLRRAATWRTSTWHNSTWTGDDARGEGGAIVSNASTSPIAPEEGALLALSRHVDLINPNIPTRHDGSSGGGEPLIELAAVADELAPIARVWAMPTWATPRVWAGRRDRSVNVSAADAAEPSRAPSETVFKAALARLAAQRLTILFAAPLSNAGSATDSAAEVPTSGAAVPSGALDHVARLAAVIDGVREAEHLPPLGAIGAYSPQFADAAIEDSRHLLDPRGRRRAVPLALP